MPRQRRPNKSVTDADGYFQHTPLDLSTLSIRVFSFLPAKSLSDPIHCSIEQIPEPKGHIAISYVWGRPVFSRTIYLNRLPFLVTEALHELLTRLRFLFPEQHRVFWVDAICIDQVAVSERNHQVQQMGSIYQNAEQVISSLDGFPDADTADLIDQFWSITEIDDETQSASSLVERLYDVHGVASHAGPSPLFNSVSFWTTLHRICHLEYWTRTWIVQEVLLNKHVLLLCGYSGIDGVTLFKFLRGCIQSREWLENTGSPCHFTDMKDWPAVRLASAGAEFGFERAEGDIYAFLETTKRGLCADVRDRIYSLLTLSRLALAVRYDEPAIELLLRTYAKAPNGNANRFGQLTEALSLSYKDVETALNTGRRKFVPRMARPHLVSSMQHFYMNKNGSSHGSPQFTKNPDPMPFTVDRMSFCTCSDCRLHSWEASTEAICVVAIYPFYGSSRNLFPMPIEEEDGAFIEFWKTGAPRPIIGLAKVDPGRSSLIDTRPLRFRVATPTFLNTTHGQDPPIIFFSSILGKIEVALSQTAAYQLRTWRGLGPSSEYLPSGLRHKYQHERSSVWYPCGPHKSHETEFETFRKGQYLENLEGKPFVDLGDEIIVDTDPLKTMTVLQATVVRAHRLATPRSRGILTRMPKTEALEDDGPDLYGFLARDILERKAYVFKT